MTTCRIKLNHFKSVTFYYILFRYLGSYKNWLAQFYGRLLYTTSKVMSRLYLLIPYTVYKGPSFLYGLCQPKRWKVLLEIQVCQNLSTCLIQHNKWVMLRKRSNTSETMNFLILATTVYFKKAWSSTKIKFLVLLMTSPSDSMSLLF